jgi:hypothetical protein
MVSSSPSLAVAARSRLAVRVEEDEVGAFVEKYVGPVYSTLAVSGVTSSWPFANAKE